MSETKFDLGRWLNADRGDELESRSGETCGWTQQNYLFEHVETLVSEIEASLVNLTKTYDEWLNIGYSLADGLGANGSARLTSITRFPGDVPGGAHGLLGQALQL